MNRLRLRYLLAVVVLALQLAAAPTETALDRYVHTPDSSFKFEMVSTI